VLTGYGSISTAVKAIKTGAGNYLAKPVDLHTILSAFDGVEPPSTEDPVAKPISLRNLEWEHIQRVLDHHGGNISATARSLGMHRRTLQRKLQKRSDRP
jgi:two-component system response regulator RegA